MSSFLDANFYSVNGSAVSKKDLEFIKEAKKKRDIIVLTDPDFPGQKIRNYLNENIPGLKNAFVRKEVSIKRNKVGVAESTKEEVLSALDNLLTYEINLEQNITVNDVVELGLSGTNEGSLKRKNVCEKLHIGYCNCKTFVKYINMLGITKKELEVIVNAER